MGYFVISRKHPQASGSVIIATQVSRDKKTDGKERSLAPSPLKPPPNSVHVPSLPHLGVARFPPPPEPKIPFLAQLQHQLPPTPRAYLESGWPRIREGNPPTETATGQRQPWDLPATFVLP